MSMWNPWRGCKKCSEGCLHCYIHKGDAKRGIDTASIVKTKDFYKPIQKLKNGNYKMKAGLIYLCFSTDFLIEEADAWRQECWQMIRQRSDCTFLFLTKRIDRFMKCIPNDWGDGYENVVVCCTVENQRNADYKLGIFDKLPIKHKCITAQPLIEAIDMERHLDGIELVVVGGESDQSARPLDYAWVVNRNVDLSGLLWCRCSNDSGILFLTKTYMVVFVRTDCSIVLPECRSIGRLLL